MPENGNGREKISGHLSFSFVFCACALLAFLMVIMPVSASLNGTETLISTDIYKTHDYPPAIYGDWIASSTPEIFDDPGSGISSIYVMVTNLATGDQYVVPSPMTYWNTAPFIDQDTLVWMQDPDGVNFNLIAYDLVNGTPLAEIPVTPGDYYTDYKNNIFPKISGNSIVWQDWSNGDWDIFLYDLTWGNETPEQIITGLEDQKNPAISGNYIVYEYRSGPSSMIYLYNISNSTSVQISTGADEVTPAIDGMNVVWQNATAKRIILYNITTGETRQIPPADLPSDQTNPKISGNYIVWEDTRNRYPVTDIYQFDIADGSERLLTPGSTGYKRKPAVYGNRIVWGDSRAIQSGAGLIISIC